MVVASPHSLPFKSQFISLCDVGREILFMHWLQEFQEQLAVKKLFCNKYLISLQG
jgi:hypothetical protein